MRLNGEIVEDKIRNIEISNLVSEISKNAFVRKKMVLIQQSYSTISNLVMDGRDIGSVVFPNADIKFWVTATEEKTSVISAGANPFKKKPKKGEFNNFQKKKKEIKKKKRKKKKKKLLQQKLWGFLTK